MSRWMIKPSSLFVLASLFLVMLVIVVLPFVDLRDTAFHEGTAPVVVHARATSAPAALIVASVFLPPYAGEASRHFREQQVFAAFCPPNFLPILLHSLRR